MPSRFERLIGRGKEAPQENLTVETHSLDEFTDTVANQALKNRVKTFTAALEEPVTFPDGTTGLRYSTLYQTIESPITILFREIHGEFSASQESHLKNLITAFDRSQRVIDISRAKGGNYWSYPTDIKNPTDSIQAYEKAEIIQKAHEAGVTEPFPFPGIPK